MALGLTLGIILGVSGGAQRTSIQQASQQAVQSPAPISTPPSANLGGLARHHRSTHRAGGLVLSTATPTPSSTDQ
jgi:hypothetical protein